MENIFPFYKGGGGQWKWVLYWTMWSMGPWVITQTVLLAGGSSSMWHTGKVAWINRFTSHTKWPEIMVPASKILNLCFLFLDCFLICLLVSSCLGMYYTLTKLCTHINLNCCPFGGFPSMPAANETVVLFCLTSLRPWPCLVSAQPVEDFGTKSAR